MGRMAELIVQIIEYKEKYRRTKERARCLYLDPIDFPQEVKDRLRLISRRKIQLEEELKELQAKNGTTNKGRKARNIHSC